MRYREDGHEYEDDDMPEYGPPVPEPRQYPQQQSYQPAGNSGGERVNEFREASSYGQYESLRQDDSGGAFGDVFAAGKNLAQQHQDENTAGRGMLVEPTGQTTYGSLGQGEGEGRVNEFNEASAYGKEAALRHDDSRGAFGDVFTAGKNLAQQHQDENTAGRGMLVEPTGQTTYGSLGQGEGPVIEFKEASAYGKEAALRHDDAGGAFGDIFNIGKGMAQQQQQEVGLDITQKSRSEMIDDSGFGNISKSGLRNGNMTKSPGETGMDGVSFKGGKGMAQEPNEDVGQDAEMPRSRFRRRRGQADQGSDRPAPKINIYHRE